jgi:hypothetical protein
MRPSIGQAAELFLIVNMFTVVTVASGRTIVNHPSRLLTFRHWVVVDLASATTLPRLSWRRAWGVSEAASQARTFRLGRPASISLENFCRAKWSANGAS